VAAFIPVSGWLAGRYGTRSVLASAIAIFSPARVRLDPGAGRSVAGAAGRRLIVDYLHWSVIFFVNRPIGLVGLYLVHATCWGVSPHA
jgi:hypothetical protein